MSETINRYIDVVLNVPLNHAITYREPADDGKKEFPKDPFGYRVEVKFGNRKTTGFVTAVYDSILFRRGRQNQKCIAIHRF